MQSSAFPAAPQWFIATTWWSAANEFTTTGRQKGPPKPRDAETRLPEKMNPGC
jgi:hypothetical protein